MILIRDYGASGNSYVSRYQWSNCAFKVGQERAADQLINKNSVKVYSTSQHGATGIVTDDGRQYNVEVVVADNSDRLVDATCQCYFFNTTRLRKGPCEHILALRRRAASGSVSNVLKGPWGGAA